MNPGQQSSSKQFLIVNDTEDIKTMCHPFFSELKNSYGDKINYDEVAKDIQKLLIIENYIKFHEEQKGINGYIDNARLFEVENELFDFMIDLYGYNDLPKVLDKDEYKKLKNNRLAIYSKQANVPVEFEDEYYRGAAKLIYHANLMCDYDYHHGTGINSNGIYAAPRFVDAKQYADIFSSNKDEEPIIRFKINTKKIVEDIEIFKLLNKIFNYLTIPTLKDKQQEAKLLTINYFADMLSPADKNNFIELFKNDFGLLATYLGYDCICCSIGQTICILNRGTMVFEQNEFNRICNQTRIYKDGLIDHNLKSLCDFRFER